MNVARFIRKCLHDRPAALRSAKLVMRSALGQVHWAIRPSAPLRYRCPGGGVLLLDRTHSFTHCLWPAVEAYEPEVVAALRHFLRPGDVFVDVGANVGYFSVIASGLVGPAGRVLAVEANPGTFRLLERNLDINGRSDAVWVAITDRGGEVLLYEPGDNASLTGDVFSSLRYGGLVQADSAKAHRVPTSSLDAVLAQKGIDRVSLVKIDIEGAELEALRSAGTVMSAIRPTMIVEYGTNTWPAFGADSDQLLAIASRHSYTVHAIDKLSGQPVEASDSVWRSNYANLLLIPEERAAVR